MHCPDVLKMASPAVPALIPDLIQNHSILRIFRQSQPLYRFLSCSLIRVGRNNLAYAQCHTGAFRQYQASVSWCILKFRYKKTHSKVGNIKNIG